MIINKDVMMDVWDYYASGVKKTPYGMRNV